MGELSLDGSLQPLKGVLPIAIEALKYGLKGIILPKQNAKEAAIVDGLDVYGVDNIKDVIDFFNEEIELEKTVVNTREEFYNKLFSDLDFKDVKGQQNIKRAFEIAAAGGHNIIWPLHEQGRACLQRGYVPPPFSLNTPKPNHSLYPKEVLTVGDEVRTARLDRGLSQQEVCSMMSVSKGFVFEMEDRKDNNYTIFALHKAYIFLEKTPETLKLNECTLRGKLSIHRVKNGFTLK
jgi:hypothetical protein